jgi:hypothetical protein
MHGSIDLSCNFFYWRGTRRNKRAATGFYRRRGDFDTALFDATACAARPRGQERGLIPLKTLDVLGDDLSPPLLPLLPVEQSVVEQLRARHAKDATVLELLGERDLNNARWGKVVSSR